MTFCVNCKMWRDDKKWKLDVDNFCSKKCIREYELKRSNELR